MAVPSFKILYKQDSIPKADVTVKAIGYQWYWGYEYPDEDIIFDSYMIEDKDLKENQPRLLAVDNELVVPVIKFTAPKIEDAPAKCKLKIAKSIAGPGCPAVDDKGGYIVHPPPTPV